MSQAEEEIIAKMEKENEPIRTFLSKVAQGKNVKVKLGKGVFGGIWWWEDNKQLHRRVAVDEIMGLVDSVYSYSQRLPFVCIPMIHSSERE